MEFKIAWMYPDLLELYGDSGNINILKFRCEQLGLDIKIDKFTVGDHLVATEYDMVFLGGGSDREQSIFYNDLISRRDTLIKAIEEDVVFLIICGGFQLFGQYYKDANGNTIDGIGAFNYYTETKKDQERITGYIATEVDLDGEKTKIVGFENHSGQTYGVLNSFGKVLKGTGNNKEELLEGIRYKNLIGTYMHGPLLSRNPELTDYLIKMMARRKNYEVKFTDSINKFDLKAKKQVLKELDLE